MCPTPYYQIMRICKDKKHFRYQMVQRALKHGIKPTAREYNTSPQVTRKWVKRFILSGYNGIDDISRRPHHSPLKTPQSIEKEIIRLKKKYKRLGAEQIKELEQLTISPKTMRKIWRNAGISSRKRRKKHITKRNLREVKKQFLLFQQSCEDTKDLCDIPEYWPQMQSLNLPTVQYTLREVSCGIQFLGFANDRSLSHSTLFAEYINAHLNNWRDYLPESFDRQTDNGSEYCGSWNARESSSYTKAIESLHGQKHTTIFPGAHRMQSDVETAHNLIEKEFYEIEIFSSRTDFMNKAFTYQLFFNLQRPNTYKENKTPWQLAREKIPSLDKNLLLLPPLDLDALLSFKLRHIRHHSARGDQIPIGGNDLLTVP